MSSKSFILYLYLTVWRQTGNVGGHLGAGAGFVQNITSTSIPTYFP